MSFLSGIAEAVEIIRHIRLSPSPAEYDPVPELSPMAVAPTVNRRRYRTQTRSRSREQSDRPP